MNKYFYKFTMISVLLHYIFIFRLVIQKNNTPIKENSTLEFNLISSRNKQNKIIFKNTSTSSASTHHIINKNIQVNSKKSPVPQLKSIFGETQNYKIFQLSGVKQSLGSREYDTILPESIQVHAFKWAQSLAPEESVRLEPFIRQIGNRVSSEVHYLPDLVDREVTGIVDVEISTDAQGILQQMNITSEESIPELKGLVLNQIKKALKEPLSIRALTDVVKISLRIDFELVHIRYNKTTRPMEIENNEIRLHILEHKRAKYDLTEWDLDDNIFIKLFGKKKLTQQREWYDLNVKTQKLASACEIERVEEVCLNAAENFILLGQINEAHKLLKIGCENNIDTNCEKLRKFIESNSYQE